MKLKLGKRTYLALGLVAIVATLVIGVTVSSGPIASQASPGAIDDDAELLDQATISLEVTLAAAQAYADGALDETDLEFYQDRLVFNVDVGSQDVKVDAGDGTILGAESDDNGDNDG